MTCSLYEFKNSIQCLELKSITKEVIKQFEYEISDNQTFDEMKRIINSIIIDKFNIECINIKIDQNYKLMFIYTNHD